MPENLYPLLWAALIGLGAAGIIIRLIRVIPFRIYEHWRLEVEEHMATFERSLNVPNYSLSVQEKVAVFVLALAVSVLIVYMQGLSAGTVLISVYLFALLLLAGINIKHQLLPDIVVLPTMWLGLLQHAYFGSGSEYVFGAAWAYLAPFILLILIRIKTGKDFIGYGDLKCFAMAGAWFGVSALPTLFIVFFGFIIAQMIGAATIRINKPLPSVFAHIAASITLIGGMRVL